MIGGVVNMKRFALTSTCLFAIGHRVHAVLPPGYEDESWCPYDNCLLYANPSNIVGPKSEFYTCYDEVTDATTAAVWTGSLTDIVPPDGYEQPLDCVMQTGEEETQINQLDTVDADDVGDAENAITLPFNIISPNDAISPNDECAEFADCSECMSSEDGCYWNLQDASCSSNPSSSCSEDTCYGPSPVDAEATCPPSPIECFDLSDDGCGVCTERGCVWTRTDRCTAECPRESDQLQNLMPFLNFGDVAGGDDTIPLPLPQRPGRKNFFGGPLPLPTPPASNRCHFEPGECPRPRGPRITLPDFDLDNVVINTWDSPFVGGMNRLLKFIQGLMSIFRRNQPSVV